MKPIKLPHGITQLNNFPEASEVSEHINPEIFQSVSGSGITCSSDK